MSEKYPEMKQDAMVCFCNSNKAWGGGERWHLESALYLAREGYNVILACGAGDPLWRMAQEELDLDAKSERPVLSGKFRLADWSFGNLAFLNPFKGSGFSRFLAQNRVSHLILNLPADLKVGVPAAGRKNSFQGAVKVYYRRGSAIPVKASAMNGYLYSRLTALIANSKETAECVRQAHVMDPARIHVIYNGLDSVAFDKGLFDSGVRLVTAPGSPDAPDAPYAPDALDTPAAPHVDATGAAAFPTAFSAERPLVIGNAGRLSGQKAQKYLLHMSAELKRRSFPHKLLIAGDGELRGELHGLAASLGLEPCRDSGLFSAKMVSGEALRSFRTQQGDVCFAGFLKNMAPFWAATDLFALSSIWEGFGYALAEAMLAVKPLLAFDC
ncbi:glycosyltransferase, partial [Desulfovibrio sp. OttesenSCG-928-C06]|nr:glycosyltransferase [Desulfovibrio sp. OttesenSCG-928-C06]